MAWRILVVDDDDGVRGLICSTLRRRGATVDEERTAAPALERIRTDEFDLLITNLEMPGESGLWLIEEAKRAHFELPVVVVTGGVPESGIDALGLADAVITKPFRLSEFHGLIANLLDSSVDG